MTTMHRPHYRRILPAAAILLITLAGCGTTPGTPPTGTAEQTMEPEQARTEYFNLFNKIQALAPGDWDVAPPSEYQGDVCRLPDGSDGTQFSIDTSRSPLSREEMDALHDKAKTVFVSTGFTVKQESDAGPNFVRHTDVFGPDKFVMGLTTGKYEINLGGNTRCVPDPEGKFR